MSSTVSQTERGHERFREGKYEEALELYWDALAAATLDSHRIALHSNRAACYLKLRKYKEAAEECGAVLELDDKQTGALMLRAQTLVIMKDYHSALFDVNRLLEIDPSSPAYKNLQARVKTQLALDPIPEAENEFMPESTPNSPRVSKSPNTMLAAARTPTPANSKEPGTNWEAVPKPKGHSKLDYSRWDKIGADLSDDEEEEIEEQPQYRYKLKTIGLRAAASY
ncbi:hypothetical protein SELMODRAFT_162336 [Selaginella moellendorffii]|uniref:Uncharacterized protein n=1 Tax=Selaginella moellendorffii TaxID=88036 RepID=D8TA38_SELML|nr:RNA polymerase II-associated protein 3 [Selaginella moellendorffii]EFJ06393.1 hypothetical protein SELMODRAFT_162336 [Selaginella moellendorffii]|eukprot:XP_002992455.1 RNA polymerase II-associated protein 3 [Selaginella moellendorffii]